ncbi:3-methylornithine synthase [uncultured archaeon]|nr:3-methylornithine synthase [uncultured archaeon]
MCYAIPGRVVGINGHQATIDYFGEKKTALVDHSVKVGDYVYAQGGVIVDTVPEEEAKKVLAFWEKKFFELKKKDDSLSEVKPAGAALAPILSKVEKGRPLSKDEMKLILSAKGADAEAVRSFANNLRREELKNSCCVHGILEFSNHCGMNCLYCGIRATKNMERYRMNEGEIIAAANRAVKLGFKALVLQSGEDKFYTGEMLVRIVKKIRKMGVLIFLSIGERDLRTYQALYDAGARAALVRFETGNPSLYSRMRPGRRLEDRIALIRKLQEMGYLVSTGFLIGLPGEEESDLANNSRLTKQLGTDMYSFGPYVAKDSRADFDTCLNTVSLVRLIDKNAKILITTALETLSPEAKKLGLLAGGNSLMIDITPEKYAKLYVLYQGKYKPAEKEIRDTIALLHSLGRAPTDLGR